MMSGEMRLRRVFRYWVPGAIVALLCAWVVWFFVRREMIEAQLEDCIGRTAHEVVKELGLEEAEWYWTDEPPGILRGVTYFTPDGRTVKVYIAAGEPLFRRLGIRREWDYEAFLNCRVGGIQYKAWNAKFDIGPAVPWQWPQH
jgi:hypothetical protein